ncbi:MAG: cob(I)yrinic acid a,c-diamide adenosyltransferase [Defluviitaleaceae bacterium]|nr:cob(I)yrinic acid a,c-diamide adenosyltransferase [Defluviitaleaceae bacterium]
MNRDFSKTIVITGNGKGKTTSALGLCVEASKAGLKVYFGQFMKGEEYSEIKALRQLSGVSVDQYGGAMALGREINDQDRAVAKKGIERAKVALESGLFGLVVVDEINVAAFLEFLDIQEVLDLMDAKPIKTGLVLTGRYANDDVIAKADEAYEIGEIKHYFAKGVEAREGIEM